MKILRNPIRLGALAAAASALLLAACVQQDSFTIADTDEDGRVSPAEFERYMLEAIFSEADADGDAKVTFEEWKQANPSGDPKKFNAPDRDGDHVVTPSEVKAHFARQGTMADLFGKMDTDRDGFLSREEIAAFKEKMDAQAGSTKLERLSQAAEAE